jgi:hypothetical protein
MPHPRPKIQYTPPSNIVVIPNKQIIEACKKAVNGDNESWTTILNCEFENNPSNMLKESMLECEADYLSDLKNGKSYIEIIDSKLYSDEYYTCLSFIKAIEKHSGQKCITEKDYAKILGKTKVYDWTKDVFWLSKTFMMSKCLSYALRNGMKYPEVVSKMRYSFFGFPSNKILDSDEYVTINKIMENVIRFGDIFGGSFEEHDDSYDEFLNVQLEIPFGITSKIRWEDDMLYDRFSSFMESISHLTEDEKDQILEEKFKS